MVTPRDFLNDAVSPEMINSTLELQETSSRLMPLRLLYSIAIFVNAALLFWIQPLAAKMILPYVEGVPAVWNTCLFFFQGFLLLGYLYAHFGNPSPFTRSIR